MAESLQALIAGTRELQSLPSTTERLLSLLDDATAGASEVLAVIEKDPSLTANLLKLSNSAYYGLRRQVGSVRESLVMLGNQTVISLAFATSMGDILQGPLKAYGLDRNELWHHALATAQGAALLVQASGLKELKDRAFTAGLVHDIGKLILNQPLETRQFPGESGAGESDICSLELELLGFDHPTAGAALGESWNFPPELVDIIRCHHEPATEIPQDSLARAVVAANLVASHLDWGGGTQPLAAEVLQVKVRELGFGPKVLADLLNELPQDLQVFLGTVRGRPDEPIN